jgi:ATP-dependent RNA helicase DeaD
MVTILKEGLDEIIAELPRSIKPFLATSDYAWSNKQLELFEKKCSPEVSAMETMGNQVIDP